MAVTTNRWVIGARPRTLAAALSPVAVGTAAAAGGGASLRVWPAVLALVVALSLQVAVNYANDYQDGVRGADRQRVGPVRLVGGGLASPAAVRNAALISMGVAGLAGLVLAALVSPWLIAVGGACMVGAWAYTGGPRPYAHAGLGEVFVFVFFGLVAVTGSAFVQHGRLSSTAILASVPVGLLATALLVANNLRDRAGDEVVGKRTLAVRLGDRRTRALYAAMVVTSFVWLAAMAVATPTIWLSFLALPLATGPVRTVLAGRSGSDLVAVLGGTGRLQLAVATGLSIGLWVR